MNTVTITAKEFLHILNEKGINPDNLSQMVVKRLIEKGEKLATAESCTGGSISKRITDISGASGVFDCGVCSYGNNIKSKVLGVKSETLERVGAVSPETAVEMALGVKKLANSHYGLSTTGIAGPTGGTKEKPVGLVYIGISKKTAMQSGLCLVKKGIIVKIYEKLQPIWLYFLFIVK